MINSEKYLQIISLIENKINYNQIIANKIRKNPSTILKQLENLLEKKIITSKKITKQNKTIYEVNYSYFNKELINYLFEEEKPDVSFLINNKQISNVFRAFLSLKGQLYLEKNIEDKQNISDLVASIAHILICAKEEDLNQEVKRFIQEYKKRIHKKPIYKAVIEVLNKE